MKRKLEKQALKTSDKKNKKKKRRKQKKTES